MINKVLLYCIVLAVSCKVPDADQKDIPVERRDQCSESSRNGEQCLHKL